METEIVDLTRSDGDKGHPAGNGEALHGKFVLITDGQRLWLVFGSLASYPYHAHLVDRFCKEKLVPCGWVRPRDQVEIYDPSFRILGGGQILVDRQKKHVRFGGTSKAYGTYDQSRLRKVVEGSPLFGSYSIRMD